MKKSLAIGATGLALAFGVATPAVAQTTPDTQQEQESDKTGLWGLVGLLGLAGLAGLKRRNDPYDKDTAGARSTRTTTNR